MGDSLIDTITDKATGCGRRTRLCRSKDPAYHGEIVRWPGRAWDSIRSILLRAEIGETCINAAQFKKSFGPDRSVALQEPMNTWVIHNGTRKDADGRSDN